MSGLLFRLSSKQLHYVHLNEMLHALATTRASSCCHHQLVAAFLTAHNIVLTVLNVTDICLIGFECNSVGHRSVLAMMVSVWFGFCARSLPLHLLADTLRFEH